MKNTNPERALPRIEKLIEDDFCSEGAHHTGLSYGSVEFCVYYGVGTVEKGCPKTCTYAWKRKSDERDQRTRQASG